MQSPNFLITGAARSGTTSLYHYLSEHPEIFMCPTKEPCFFAFEGREIKFAGPGDENAVNRVSVNELGAYQALFNGVKNEKAIGEASVWYLYDSIACDKIRHYTPDAKLIMILRNPVDRAYSAFLKQRRENREPISEFGRALEEEEIRIGKEWGYIWHYKKAGFYYEQMKRYLDTFSKEQIKIYLFEELESNCQQVVSDIFGFLGVDQSFEPDLAVKYNESFVAKNESLMKLTHSRNPIRSVLHACIPANIRHKVTNKLQTLNADVPPIPPAIRMQLTREFRQDILNLQGLIERDLSGWLD